MSCAFARCNASCHDRRRNTRSSAQGNPYAVPYQPGARALARLGGSHTGRGVRRHWLDASLEAAAEFAVCRSIYPLPKLRSPRESDEHSRIRKPSGPPVGEKETGNLSLTSNVGETFEG